MGFRDDEIIRELSEKDDEFRTLCEQHKSYEKRLTALNKRKYLGSDERLEQNKLKKLKLQGKDKMKRRIEEYRVEH